MAGFAGTFPQSTKLVGLQILAWYYGVYSAASAMTTAMDGLFQDNHRDREEKRFPAKNLGCTHSRNGCRAFCRASPTLNSLP